MTNQKMFWKEKKIPFAVPKIKTEDLTINSRNIQEAI